MYLIILIKITISMTLVMQSLNIFKKILILIQLYIKINPINLKNENPTRVSTSYCFMQITSLKLTRWSSIWNRFWSLVL